MPLSGKHILLGITGSIAAYKAANVVRLLVKKGAEVKVVMTPLAKEFITPLTMATLSKNPILVDFFDPTNGAWNSHVSLGLWADAFLIAPCTANTMAKMAHGIADNLLLTSYLSARCPVVVAPAMDLDMYAHDATQENMNLLSLRGVMMIEPSSGELASGLEGNGRMEEPERIVAELERLFTPQDCSRMKVLITAGPTIEPIDPVRFISNHSSGKMGYALAEELARRGAEVRLVTGKTNLSTSPEIRRIDVTTAEEMCIAAKENFKGATHAIFAAAVADYTPSAPAKSKIKKQDETFALELTKTKDIAAELAAIKTDSQMLVGFALETDNELANAQKKLSQKNLDIIVLNSLNDAGAGFSVDTNRVTILSKKQEPVASPLKTKKDLAKDIINFILNYNNA